MNFFYDSVLERAMTQTYEARVRRDPQWYLMWRNISSYVQYANATATQALTRFGVKDAVFHKGHVAEIMISSQDLIRSEWALAELLPKLETLRLTSVTSALWESKLLTRIKALDISSNGVEVLEPLTRYPNLRWLDISENYIMTQELEVLARSESLSKLYYVALDDNPCGPVYTVGEDGGAIVSTARTELGKYLESLAPGGYLPWIHAPDRFGHLYPPLCEDVHTL